MSKSVRSTAVFTYGINNFRTAAIYGNIATPTYHEHF